MGTNFHSKTPALTQSEKQPPRQRFEDARSQLQNFPSFPVGQAALPQQDARKSKTPQAKFPPRIQLSEAPTTKQAPEPTRFPIQSLPPTRKVTSTPQLSKPVPVSFRPQVQETPRSQEIPVRREKPRSQVTPVKQE